MNINDEKIYDWITEGLLKILKVDINNDNDYL